eukprot:1573228-Amphidinium_carterae.1
MNCLFECPHGLHLRGVLSRCRRATHVGHYEQCLHGPRAHNALARLPYTCHLCAQSFRALLLAHLLHSGEYMSDAYTARFVFKLKTCPHGQNRSGLGKLVCSSGVHFHECR